MRDFDSVAAVLRDADVVFNAAALKQVPTCEYFPYEAVRTNIGGAENIVRAIQKHRLPVETVVGISTDKACKPVNVMGMTKAIQERVFIQGNMRCPDTRFVCVRYGNVLASRGSVIPLFHDQIRNGGPVTVTTPEMTRFLLSLDQAVDTVFAAVRSGAARGDLRAQRARRRGWSTSRPRSSGTGPSAPRSPAFGRARRSTRSWSARRRPPAPWPRGTGTPSRRCCPKWARPGRRSRLWPASSARPTDLLDRRRDPRSFWQSAKLLVEDVDPRSGELLR